MFSIRFAGTANASNQMQKQAVPIWLADAANLTQLLVAEDVPIWLVDAARKSKIADKNMC